MAPPSCSFSTLLNSSTASGLSSEYPGQVEGWVLKCTKKAYLDAKFGQATGKKLDGDIVVCEMRRALGPDGVCLFSLRVSQQISSYFSRRAAKIRQQLPNDADIRESKEADRFARARETAMAITLQHPITFDQYDFCAMAKGRSLDRLKLCMLKSTCQKLELEVPSLFAVKESYLKKP